MDRVKVTVDPLSVPVSVPVTGLAAAGNFVDHVPLSDDPDWLSVNCSVAGPASASVAEPVHVPATDDGAAALHPERMRPTIVTPTRSRRRLARMGQGMNRRDIREAPHRILSRRPAITRECRRAAFQHSRGRVWNGTLCPVHAALSDFRALETFVRARLADPLPGADAQRRFAPRPLREGWRPEMVPDDARRAAALVLIYPGAAGPSIPLTLRHADLPDHGGQVSLPGGKIDHGETAEAAALREVHEELGLDTSTVRLLGPLSSFWVVVSGFVVFPFVGVTDRRPDFRPAAGEVAEVIEAPIADLLDTGRRGWSQRPREGVLVRFPYVEVAGHKVWGATAMMLSEFGALFDPAFAPPEGE